MSNHARIEGVTIDILDHRKIQERKRVEADVKIRYFLVLDDQRYPLVQRKSLSVERIGSFTWRRIRERLTQAAHNNLQAYFNGVEYPDDETNLFFDCWDQKPSILETGLPETNGTHQVVLGKRSSPAVRFNFGKSGSLTSDQETDLARELQEIECLGAKERRK
ncbi:hypothetical protein [uncultured Tateyamaria sp.]|uniref:hypothetical protein n=1 Tax=uncultured Tateyamaria sp. TaxID=455651 RepID=UPI00260C60FA|nr:hypothetical protein [uncultured Tateyamaria sp.]